MTTGNYLNWQSRFFSAMDKVLKDIPKIDSSALELQGTNYARKTIKTMYERSWSKVKQPHRILNL